MHLSVIQKQPLSWHTHSEKHHRSWPWGNLQWQEFVWACLYQRLTQMSGPSVQPRRIYRAGSAHADNWTDAFMSRYNRCSLCTWIPTSSREVCWIEIWGMQWICSKRGQVDYWVGQRSPGIISTITIRHVFVTRLLSIKTYIRNDIGGYWYGGDLSYRLHIGSIRQVFCNLLQKYIHMSDDLLGGCFQLFCHLLIIHVGFFETRWRRRRVTPRILLLGQFIWVSSFSRSCRQLIQGNKTLIMGTRCPKWDNVMSKQNHVSGLWGYLYPNTRESSPILGCTPEFDSITTLDVYTRIDTTIHVFIS